MSCCRHNIYGVFIFSRITGSATLEDCYQWYFQELVQSVEHIIHHHDLSEDIVQNLFLELLQSQSVRVVADYQHLKRYFHLAARRRAYDWLRSNKRVRKVPLSEAMNMQRYLSDPVERILSKEEFRIITDCLRKQQDRNQRILLLRINGASVKTISHQFGIAPVTVYAILRKMRRDLKNCLCSEEKIQ
ncbi:MAG: RNA polymerase sigma factor [Agathobaculum desmolans]|uniref:RNA polymerase sigma factor n=1 Tax=Agathobaculum desmolans TaxID=39484 RepID=UPI0039935583